MKTWNSSDPETGKTIFRCRLLEAVLATAAANRGQRGPRVALTASQPEVEAAAIHRIWQCLQRVLEGSPGRLDADLRFSATELTLCAADGSQTLTGVEGLLGDLAGRDARPAPFPAGRGRHARAGPHSRGAQPPGVAAGKAASSYTRATASCPATCWPWDSAS